MNWRTGLLLLTLGAFICNPLFSGTAQAAEKKTKQETTVSKKEKTRGEKNENIKSKSELNEPRKVVEAPPQKGGKTRGRFCNLTVDNFTQSKVQLYVDGDYVGLVPSYGMLTASSPSGALAVYGVADFTDGSQSTWGPRMIACDDIFTWTLK